MKTQKNNPKAEKPLIEVMIADKNAMREYIKNHGTLKGYKSDNFKFAKPL